MIELHFCLLNITKKSPNTQYLKRKQEKEMMQNLKRKKKETETQLKELEEKKN